MKRVFFFGNSHLAAVKLGYDLVRQDYPNIDVTFLGMPGDVLQEYIHFRQGILRVRNIAEPNLIFSSEKGRKEFDLSDYDAYVLCGLGLEIFRLLKLCDQAAPDDLNTLPDQAQLVSAACFAQMCASVTRNSFAGRFSRKLAALFPNRPILILPEPLPHRIGAHKGKYGQLQQMAGTSDEETMASYFRNALRSLESSHIGVIQQPAETLQSPLLTRPHLGKGAIRLREELRIGHANSDNVHMNGEFGSIMIRACLSNLPGT